jgi:hypothetical protein
LAAARFIHRIGEILLSHEVPPILRAMKPSESDLYAPVKAYLEGLGFTVKGEIRGCDLVARGADGEAVVIAELKLMLSFELVLQAVERLAIADEVWIAVPLTQRGRDRDRRAHRLCKLLGIGLLTVHPRHGTVEIITAPAPYQPRRNARRRSLLVREFERRRGDPEIGGSANRTRMTAYRQFALDCAIAMLDGEQSSKILRGIVPEATKYLYANLYGWFERLGTGRYTLTPAGISAARTRLAEIAPAGQAATIEPGA